MTKPSKLKVGDLAVTYNSYMSKNTAFLVRFTKRNPIKFSVGELVLIVDQFVDKYGTERYTVFYNGVLWHCIKSELVSLEDYEKL